MTVGQVVDLERETLQVARFLYRYVQVLDRGDFAAFPDFFAETGTYSLFTAENLQDKGMALYTDRGREALKERAAYASGYWLAPTRKTTHVVTNTYVEHVSGSEARAHSNVVLYRVNRRGQSMLHVVGEYRDTMALGDDGVRFLSHQVVLDGSLLPADMGSIL